ncbi:MAG: HAMP domain-containing histidine kinase [Flavobacteriales bacterium]|nr:HAMP domain-containing histidine kinase [Flavobacteriales bacterium]
MKLLTINTLWYAAISALAFALGGVGLWFALDDLMHEEMDERLTQEKEWVIRHLEPQTVEVPAYAMLDKRIQITPLENPVHAKDDIRDTVIEVTYVDGDREALPYRRLVSFVTVNDRHYRIMLAVSLLETDDLGERITELILWLFGCTLVMIILFQWLVARKLWKPFYELLSGMKAYDITVPEQFSPQLTRVAEFKELQSALETLTRRVEASYANLKEFSENASHEIQTPLAIILSKLEGMMQSSGLDERQASDLSVIREAAHRLSRLNQALLLLTKIENRQFTAHAAIHPAPLIRDMMKTYEELINGKSLQTEVALDEKVELSMHTTLADVLFSNLIGNAIKHGVSNGVLKINLDSKQFMVMNTGAPDAMDPELLFTRFYKKDPSSSSLGLGLAIAKKICDVMGYRLGYRYDGSSIHVFTVDF